MAEGKKNRKVGKSKRKPTNATYVAERRWEKNKARRIAKEADRQAMCAKVRKAYSRDHDGKPRDVQRRIRVMRRNAA